MQVDTDIVTDLANALERQVEVQGEAAKRAIREYKKTILHGAATGGVRQTETRRKVEQAVNQYMQLRRRLDELRVEISARQMPGSPG